MTFIEVVFVWLITLVAISFSILYLFFKRRYGYWKKKGVFGPPPTFPIGNMDGILTKRKHLGETINEIYRVYRKEPYVGIYSVNIPALVINDLELMKRILIKDFQYFHSRGSSEHGDHHDPLASNLFNLTGDRWRTMRNKLSPTFTSGKMRMMFDSMAVTQKTMLAYLQKETAKSEVIDAKQLAGHFTTDAIASAIFGLECNSFEDPQNQFRLAGIEGITPSKLSVQIGLVLQMLAPSLKEFLGLYSHEPDLAIFFTKLVKNTIEHREKNNISRNDFMQLLIQMKNNELRDDDGNLIDSGSITLEEMVSQTFIFLVAGFDPSSTTASCLLYHMALYPQYQVKVRKEIHKVLCRHGGKYTYEALMEMKYLTMVIEETLRLFPGLSFHARRCVRDYKIPGTDLTLEKDNLVFIPVMGLHTDPEIYTSPLTFDPERFSPEAKASRHPATWIPFGNGPRNCIASRFGMMMVRLVASAILSEYEVLPCNQTQVPIIIDTRCFPITPRDGVFLKIRKVEKMV